MKSFKHRFGKIVGTAFSLCLLANINSADLFAASSYAQSTQLTVRMNNSIENIFDYIENNSMNKVLQNQKVPQ